MFCNDKVIVKYKNLRTVVQPYTRKKKKSQKKD